MRSLCFIALGICLAGLLAGPVRAESFQLADGQTLSGDVISFNESGLVVRLGDGKYSERMPWAKFSQAALKTLSQKPKIAPFVEPFIEIPQEDRIKKTEVDLKPVPRLERPAPGSLLGALFGSSVGLLTLFLIYAANIYAAFEVAVFRARPKALVCGLAAIPVLGVLVTIIFLAMPTQIEKTETTWTAEAAPEAGAEGEAAPEAAPAHGTGLRLAHHEESPAAPAAAQVQVFQRGQFTFNRRFIETKFAGFFPLIRRDPEKDQVLIIKSARGEFAAHRITRIASNDMHVEVRKGVATQEVAVAFAEIQEIQVKHKDA